MPWTCPEGCHRDEKFRVVVAEHRTDTIVHFYFADDREFQLEMKEPKVFVGPESDYDAPTCDICESLVEWKEEAP